MLKKILVPVDGSENSMRALDFALELGGEATEIVVCNVTIPYDYTLLFPRESEKDWEESTIKRKEAVKQETLKLVKKHVSKAGKPEEKMTYKQLVGTDPAEAMAEFIEKAKPELVVMGNRGLGQLYTMVLGSVSNKLLQLCKCPVTIVK